MAMGLAGAAALGLLLAFAAVDLVVVDEASGRDGEEARYDYETRREEVGATTGRSTRVREEVPFIVSS